MTHILAIDQGTTSTRAILFNENMQPADTVQQEFTQHFPNSGWVEHDPEEIWQSVLDTCTKVAKNKDVRAIGITNQRETTLVWDKKTGAPVYNAIVWQDRRTADTCAGLKEQGHEQLVKERTGLLLDPYFSATKLAWILDNVEGARARADAGELLFGTIDSFLIWRLTKAARHVTDATNAARTMLYDIHKGVWDPDICALLNIPMTMLPEVLDCAADFGITDILGAETPILGVAGDQQAATIGQACFAPGMMKSTYGTGCFALLNTGDTPVASENKMLTTIAYRLEGRVTYALEGSIFIAGASVQWLRDGLGIIDDAAQSGAMAEAADPQQEVILVPAFTGLGAPYWDANCRGAVFGLTRNTGPNEFARAALQSVGFQTCDLLNAMKADMEQADSDTRGAELKTVLRVDGGMAASDWTMQFLADITGASVDRPTILETTALGAAWLAGMRAGLYPDQQGFAKRWALDRRFEVAMSDAERTRQYGAWKQAITRTLT